ncbi:uncharacterized protein LOC143492615 [Brachyhypopomus gauderio]|uniref:uncharacterized protein LOC143492615 n=1 Tax=Brachyhypopomus gauderio TaxID=698409 RepID=UPI004041D8E1
MKRSAVVTLLLLVHNSLQEAESAEASNPTNFPTELKQLKDTVYQQGTALVELKTEMKYVQQENTALKSKIAQRIKQTKQMENKVETLNKEISAQTAEMSAVKDRLAASEGEVKILKKQKTATKTALDASKNQVMILKKTSAALNARLATSESDVDYLKRANIDRPKVAFSAALDGSLGSLNSITNVVYSVVITNVGGAYSPSTGMLTAPVRGVYYVRFTTCSATYGYYSGVNLYKNNEKLLFLYGYGYNNYGNNYKYIAGGLTLQLQKGDVVNTRLPASYYLSACGFKGNTFSGHLIFTN